MKRFISIMIVGTSLSLSPLSKANNQEKDLSQNIKELVDTIESAYDKQGISQSESDFLDLEHGEKYVKFSDIKKWRLLGGQNAAGYDENGKLLAIYDLTYQNIRSREFAARSILGTIGLGDINLREMIQLLRKHLYENREQAKLTSEPDEIFKPEDYAKIDSTLEELSQQYGHLTNSFAEPDWKKIPLKKDHLESASAAATDPHAFFKLSDIDFEQILNQSELEDFNEKLTKLQENFNALLDTDSSFLLNELAYQRNSNRSYSLVYQHSPNRDNSRPEKVLDFRRYQSTFAYSLLNMLTMKGISQIVGLIPSPVSNIFAYAIGRWMQLYQQQVSFHRARAFEYIVEAELNMPSPFQFLTAREREMGAIYVLSHESGIWQRLFSPRNEAFYHNQIKNDLAQVDKNKKWGQKFRHQFTSTNSPFFTYDLDVQSQKTNSLLVMTTFSKIKNRPITAIDYQDPHDIRIIRNVAKGISALLQFISVPLPGANMLMGYLYNFFVMNDINAGIYWDSRLISFFQQDAKAHNQELEWLYGQRINPLELDLAEEKEFVERSRQYLKDN